MEPSRVGRVCTDGQLGERDAFHVPCILARSFWVVQGGQSVCFIDEELQQVNPCIANFDNRHGIVDPFIKTANPGEMFWVLLNPNLVSKLNHHFEVDIKTDRKVVLQDECSSCYGQREDPFPIYDGCSGCY